MKLLDRIAAAFGPSINVVGLGGEHGSELVADTDPREGEYKAIEIPAGVTAEFDASTQGNMIGLPGATIEGPRILHGCWTRVQLTDGEIALYNS